MNFRGVGLWLFFPVSDRPHRLCWCWQERCAHCVSWSQLSLLWLFCASLSGENHQTDERMVLSSSIWNQLCLCCLICTFNDYNCAIYTIIRLLFRDCCSLNCLIFTIAFLKCFSFVFIFYEQVKIAKVGAIFFPFFSYNSIKIKGDISSENKPLTAQCVQTCSLSLWFILPEHYH